MRANIAADVRQKKIRFLEVNFYDNKKSSDYIGFTDVFEFFFESSSKWRFYVIFRIVKKTIGICMKIENDERWTQKVNFRGTPEENIFRSQFRVQPYYIL